MTNTVDPRSITDAERPFLDRLDTLGEIADLRRRIIDVGESAATANGIVGWLVAKKVGDPDVSSSDVRARYRRILRELQELDRPTKGRRRPPAAAASAKAPASGAAPIILDRGSYVALAGAGAVLELGATAEQGELAAVVRMPSATSDLDAARDLRTSRAA